jgi:hypothetical protein
MTWREHTSWIVGLALRQAGPFGRLVSGWYLDFNMLLLIILFYFAAQNIN